MKNITTKKVTAFIIAFVVFGLTLKFFQAIIGVITSLGLTYFNVRGENNIEISKMAGEGFGLVCSALLARGVYRRINKNKNN